MSVAIAASLMDKAGRKALLFTSGLCRINNKSIIFGKCNSLEKIPKTKSSFIPSGFLMFLAMLSMTMYTHKTQCNHGNLTVTEGLKSTYGGLTGPAFDPITLIPLISTMVIIFGEFSWFQDVCSYTVWQIRNLLIITTLQLGVIKSHNKILKWLKMDFFFFFKSEKQSFWQDWIRSLLELVLVLFPHVK